jgi:hypothetical protein
MAIGIVQAALPPARAEEGPASPIPQPGPLVARDESASSMDEHSHTTAQAVCGAVNQLLGRDASVVAVSVLESEGRTLAMAMLRDGDAFCSATAAGPGETVAVEQAVLDALGLSDGILTATALQWASESGVRAVSVVEGDQTTMAVGNEDRVRAHLRLAGTLPAPGRMALTTEDAEYRVLALSSSGLVVSTDRGAEVLAEIDAWMARAETLLHP